VQAGLEQIYGPDSDDPNVMYYLTALLASGAAAPWAIEAADLLREEWGVSADVCR
jgi:pyruvate dehydrogenase E1 component